MFITDMNKSTLLLGLSNVLLIISNTMHIFIYLPWQTDDVSARNCGNNVCIEESFEDISTITLDYTCRTEVADVYINEDVIETENPYTVYYSDEDAVDIAKVLRGECADVPSRQERACVAWTILNRVDNDGRSIHDTIRMPNQFEFKEHAEVRDDLLDLAYDVLERWNKEKNGEENVGRVLPREYTFYYGDGRHNYFRNAFRKPYDIWDYSLENPYET